MASSIVVVAAYGVDLRVPLKPTLPVFVQEITLPLSSVKVTSVLLKVALMYMRPEVVNWGVDLLPVGLVVFLVLVVFWLAFGIAII